MGGFFGAISRKPCVNEVFYGTDYNSHLGTKRAGMVTFDREWGFNRKIHSIERDYFRSKFEDELDSFTGNAGIGVISDTDPQPILVNSHLGRYAVVTVAKIGNLRKLADELLAQRMHLSELSANNINQTEVVALMINMGADFVEGINLVYSKIEGSCSMLILTEDGIIAARDYLGRTPIVIGRNDDGYAVTGESGAFENLGYTTVRDLGPGEIVRLRPDGIEVLQEPAPCEQICSFLWVYYGFPTSTYDGVNVEAMREAVGKAMGRKDDTEADSVCGIPDSGVGCALGYAEGHGIPYRRAVLKYTPTWPRSFTPGNQSRRDLVARMKLIPNAALLKGQRVVFCDASIVRGHELPRRRGHRGTCAHIVPSARLRLPVYRLHVVEERPRAHHQAHNTGFRGRPHSQTRPLLDRRHARIRAHGGRNRPSARTLDAAVQQHGRPRGLNRPAKGARLHPLLRRQQLPPLPEI